MLNLRSLRALALAALLGTAGTAVSAADVPESADPIRIAIHEWTGQHITSYVAGEVLKKMGYNVEYVTAAMLPVIGYLTVTIPGANSKVLFYCLSVGSAMGGNGSLIGASANMITSGIAERAGYPITYRHFMKKGFPALLITVGLASLWLVFRFLL